MDSRTLGDFAKVLQQGNALPLSGAQSGGLQGNRLHLDGEKVKNGLGQLVLTLVKLVHELLEQQAIRRIEGGSLSEREIERLGLALMQQGKEIDRLRKEFGLEEDDLNLDLGPLGRLF
ncbi:MAG: gas vesicle protein K [Solidesulfovibrio sp.]